MAEEKIPTEENLPVDVSELGELKSAKQACPGVYYFVMKPEDQFGLLSKEYYLVLENAPISSEARRYGKPFQNDQCLLFALGEDNSGNKIVEYEIYRYRVAHHLPLPEGESLHGCAFTAPRSIPSILWCCRSRH